MNSLVYHYEQWDWFNVQLIWMKGKEFTCTQVPEDIYNVIYNGVNAIGILSLAQIIALHLYGKNAWVVNPVPRLMALKEVKLLRNKIVRSKENFSSFYSSITNQKHVLSGEFTKMKAWPALDEAWNFALNLAKADIHAKSTFLELENDNILQIYNPRPDTRYTRRFQKKNSAKEITFVRLCQKQKNVDSRPLGDDILINDVLKEEYMALNQERTKAKCDVIPDIDLEDWLRRNRNLDIGVIPSINDLVKKVHALQFEQSIEELQIAISNEEQALKQSICHSLLQLKQLQIEKDRANLIGNINLNMLNKQCLPTLAKIWAKMHQNDIPPGMEIEEIEPEVDSSWTGTWSL